MAAATVGAAVEAFTAETAAVSRPGEVIVREWVGGRQMAARLASPGSAGDEMCGFRVALSVGP